MLAFVISIVLGTVAGSAFCGFAVFFPARRFWIPLLSAIALFIGLRYAFPRFALARDVFFLIAWFIVSVTLLEGSYWPNLPRRLICSAAGPYVYLKFGGLGDNPDGFTLVFGILGFFLLGCWAITLPFMPPDKKVLAGKIDKNEGNEEAFRVRLRSSNQTLDDVVGMEEFKARLLTAGQDVLERRSQRNGILLHGAPGNGKTMFAEALAGSLKLRMAEISFGELSSRWLGETEERLQGQLTSVRKQAPCLLFLDEVDSLLTARQPGGTGSTVTQANNVVNILLTELVKLRGKQIVIVAASNHLDQLDPAAIREGRFDFKMEVPDPDSPARIHLLTQTLAKTLQKRRGDIAVDAEAVARAAKRWEGYSAARMTAVAQEAAEGALRANRPGIQFDDLMAAMRAIQGRKGRLSESAPRLEDLSLSQGQGDQLLGLAARMQHIETIEELGGRVPRAVLFYGPPGTGKTLLAQALAKSADWGFLTVAGADLVQEPSRIDKLVAEAREIRPCVVFIDEADDILAHRSGQRAALANSQAATNKLLTAIDGAGGRISDVMWIAATNHLEEVDPAALRGGRFGEKVAFELPDQQVIAAIAAKWMANSKARFAPEVQPQTVAALLVQAEVNVGDIQEILQAAVDAVIAEGLRTNRPALVGMPAIEAAMRAVKLLA